MTVMPPATTLLTFCVFAIVVVAVIIGSEEPECEVNVMDAAVHEDAAGVFCVFDEKPRGVEFIACLAAEDGGGAVEAGGDFGVGGEVGGVGAAGEAAHYF